MPSRLGLAKWKGEARWEPEVRVMTREAKAGVVEARRAGRRMEVRRKWERWLVASWVSKPSGVMP